MAEVPLGVEVQQLVTLVRNEADKHEGSNKDVLLEFADNVESVYTRVEEDWIEDEDEDEDEDETEAEEE